jgi:hypothetical protein
MRGRGAHIQFHLFLISAPDGGAATLCPIRLVSWEEKPGIYCVEGYVDLQYGGFGEKKIFTPAGIRTLDYLARILVWIPTTMPRLRVQVVDTHKKNDYLLILHHEVCICCGYDSILTPNKISCLQSNLWTRPFSATCYSV